MEFRYTYLLMAGLFGLLWAALYATTPQARRKMVQGSLLWAGFGVLADLLYTQDWWSPFTITGTTIGPEALLTAAGMAGVAAALPMAVLQIQPTNQAAHEAGWPRALRLIGLLGIATNLLVGSFYLLGWNSLEATMFALAVPLAFMWTERPDLVAPALWTAALLSMAAAAIYSVLSLLTPGWIDAFYHFENTPRILIGPLPLDDLLLYLVAGAFLGTYYEWWLGGGYESLMSDCHSETNAVGSRLQ